MSMGKPCRLCQINRKSNIDMHLLAYLMRMQTLKDKTCNVWVLVCRRRSVREREGAKLSANVGTAHEGVGCGNLCSCHCVSTHHASRSESLPGTWRTIAFLISEFAHIFREQAFVHWS